MDETQNFCLDDGAWLERDAGLVDQPTAVMSGLSISADSATKLFRSDPDAGSMSGYRPNSIAVLPFAHLSSDPDDEYFCDGLAEELINALARVGELKVVARTSAFSFKGKNVDAAQIGSILKVQHIVEGSVRKSGERMRITVQLINAADGYHIWSDKYDTEIHDIFDVQDEITRSVVSALKTKLLGESQESPDEMAAVVEELKQHASSVEAYQLYLRGKFFFNKFTTGDFYRALGCYDDALEIDPNYAPAHAALAETHVFLTEFGPVKPLDGMPKALAAAERAISLDPMLPEAHTVLGVVLGEFEYDFAGAEKAFIRAIELSPNDVMTHEYYAGLLCQLGRFEDARKHFRRALNLDPLSPVANWIYPFAMFFERKYDECIERAKWILELEPDFTAAHLALSFACQAKEDFAGSVEAYARFLDLCGLETVAGRARATFKVSGWEAFLRLMVGKGSDATVSSYITAVFHTALGNSDDAFRFLSDSLEKREGHIVMLKVDPRFDNLRADPRFQKLLSDIGFPT